MICYLGLVWNASSEEDSAAAHKLLRRLKLPPRGWHPLIVDKGLAVFGQLATRSAEDELHVLPRGRGVVFGRIFERKYVADMTAMPTAPSPVKFEEERSASLISTKGRLLTEDYWGGYIAFLRDPLSTHQWVIRDPTGHYPCQWTQILGVNVYFMRMSDCEQLAPLKFSINKHYLVGHLMYVTPNVRETSLSQVETVLPGERIEHQGSNRTQSFIWNPLQIAQTDMVEDDVEAERLIRNTVRKCVHAWASCFDGILMALSGGLDSSIVLACLTDAPTRPRLLCQTNYLREARTNELAYARLAAARAQVELIENEANAAVAPESLVATSRSLFPLEWPPGINRDPHKNQFMSSRGLSAEFRGHFGDEIFVRFGSLPMSVDYVWLHRLGRRLLSVALDDAIADGVSVWTVLGLARKYGLFKRPWHMRMGFSSTHMPLMPMALKKEAWRDLSHWHPLFREIGVLPPAKFEHAHLLTYGTRKTHVPLNDSDNTVYLSPLGSQPLLELSLRIPLYVMRKGGRDRAITRRAFANDVPREIINRKSKTFGTDQFRVIVSQNFKLIRELLLDGFLSQEGLLDRAKLEEALTGDTSDGQVNCLELCDYLSVEAWVRGWSSTASAAPTSQLEAVQGE